MKEWKDGWVSSRIKVTTTINRPASVSRDAVDPCSYTLVKGKTPRDLNFSQHKNKNENVENELQQAHDSFSLDLIGDFTTPLHVHVFLLVGR